jgi:hypothetical protein
LNCHGRARRKSPNVVGRQVTKIDMLEISDAMIGFRGLKGGPNNNLN